MAAIAYIFTLSCVAEILDEDEDLLHEIVIDMEPEDGVIAVHGCGEDYTPAFTKDGIEKLKTLILMYRKEEAPADPTRP
jgi:hypothetical protein